MAYIVKLIEEAEDPELDDVIDEAVTSDMNKIYEYAKKVSNGKYHEVEDAMIIKYSLNDSTFRIEWDHIKEL